MIAIIAGILASVATVIGSVAAEKLWDELEESSVNGTDMAPDKIIGFINKITNLCRAKGNKAINLLNNKLSAIQLPVGSSQTVKNAIMDTRRTLTHELQNAQNTMADVEAKLSTADNQASFIASQPAHSRSIMKNNLQQIAESIEEPVRQINNMEENINAKIQKE